MKKLIFIGLSIFFFFAVNSCKDDSINADYFIPDGPVSLVINTDLPEFYKLKTPGNYVYAPGGNRGVIVMHAFDDSYVAIERTCSFNPDLACSKIFVDSLNISLRCGNFNNGRWDTCCQSRFLYDGQLAQGPARYNLRTYNTQVSGAVVTVRH